MTFLDLALDHARKGWLVFPTQPDKRPWPEMTTWEARATTREDTIRTWWERRPSSLPAIVPGRLSKTVIDVDRHEGKPDGYRSLVDEEIQISEDVHRSVSLSGNGLHYWFRGLTSSVNGILPGVDRKSKGGYVIEVKPMPIVSDIRTKVPSRLQGANPSVARRSEFQAGSEAWFVARLGEQRSPYVTKFMRKYTTGEVFTGHENMIRAQVYLVKLASEGHGGVPEALSELFAIWDASPHASAENHVTEWSVALANAIRNYGGSIG